MTKAKSKPKKTSGKARGALLDRENLWTDPKRGVLALCAQKFRDGLGAEVARTRGLPAPLEWNADTRRLLWGSDLPPWFTSGRAKLVETFETYNMFGLLNPDGRTRFLTWHEIAILSLLAGNRPGGAAPRLKGEEKVEFFTASAVLDLEERQVRVAAERKWDARFFSKDLLESLPVEVRPKKRPLNPDSWSPEPRLPFETSEDYEKRAGWQRNRLKRGPK